MDYKRLSVLARDASGHAVTYNWSIEADGTGKAYFLSRTGGIATVGFPWLSAAQAGQLSGKTVVIKVVASHTNPEQGLETIEQSTTVTIKGVNRPPVPVIGGNLGTSSAPILSGQGVCVNAYESVEPDGGTFRPTWALGTKTGGVWLTSLGDYGPALIGSDGPEACFNVLNMSAPIEQKVHLKLEDGLHAVTATAIAYLAPATTQPPPSTTNRAPTITLPQPTVTGPTNSTVVLQAYVDDLDGNALDFGVALLQGTNTTIAFTAVPLTATRTRIDVARSTGPNAGNFTYRFTARERSTTERYSATPADLTLVVSSSTSGGPGDYTDTPSTGCSDTPPAVTISPDPRNAKPVFYSGSAVSIVATGYDTSEKQAGGIVGGGSTTTQKGIATMTWDQSQLQALGVTGGVNTVLRSNPYYTDSTLTFTAPAVTSARDVYFTVTAADVVDCTRTVRFAVQIQPAPQTNNEPPVARMTYRVGSFGTHQPAPSEGGVAVESGSNLTVMLNGGVSTDDGGADSLTYAWELTNNTSGGGASLSSTTLASTSVSIQAKTQGSVTVTLTVTDQGGLSSQTSILLNIGDPNQKPVAKVSVKCDGLAQNGPVEEGALITLDGSASTLADGSAGTSLTYRWSQIEGPPVALSDAQKAVARFPAPAVDQDGTDLKFQLVVTDPESAAVSDPKPVTVEVNIAFTYFSQIGVGPLDGENEFRTVLVLVNRTETPAPDVSVQFLNSDGTEMEVQINDQPWDKSPIQVPPLSSRKLTFTGATLQAGWARVKSNVRLTGLVLFQVIGPDGVEVKREVGLYSSTPGTKFGTFFDSLAENAVAIANPSEQMASVRIRVVDDAMTEVASKLLVLDAREHRAEFLEGEFLSELPPDFAGTLLIESDVPVTVTVLKTKDGVVFSTLPLAAVR